MMMTIVSFLLSIVFLRFSIAQDVLTPPKGSSLLGGIETRENSQREPKTYDIYPTSEWNPVSLSTILMTTDGERADDISDLSVLGNSDLKKLTRFNGLHALICMRLRQLNYNSHPRCQTYDALGPKYQPRQVNREELDSSMDDGMPIRLISSKGKDMLRKRSHSNLLSIQGPLKSLASMISSTRDESKNNHLRDMIFTIGRK